MLHVHAQQKDSIIMNNITSGKVTSYTEIEFRSLLLSEIKAMLLILDRNEVPPFDECNSLQNSIREYADYLIQKKTAQADSDPPINDVSDILISFNDRSGENVKSNDIIADLIGRPDLMAILYSISLRKIVAENELSISKEQKEKLFSGGYLAILKIGMPAKDDEYLALTSKGWLCFQRKVITQRLRKEQGVSSLFLPVWLAVPQIKWQPGTYQRALMLRSYYERKVGARDFMIFSFPENAQLLFGCYASPISNVVYACAVTEKNPLTEEEQKTLNRIVSSESVDHLCLISDSERYGKRVLEILNKKLQFVEKVELVMENAYE